MKKLDLHGKTYFESRTLALTFVENNINDLPIKIITGNSNAMIEIVQDIATKKGLKYDFESYVNLGALIITEKY